jgi:hypothetical protein
MTRPLKGAKLWIGPAIDRSVVNTVEEFEVLTYVKVGDVEDYGEVGDESPIVTFTSVEDARTRNFKDARNAGTQVFVVGRVPLDAGQQAMRAAEQTDFDYAIKIELNDKPTPAYTNSFLYYPGIVASKRIRMGAAGNVVRDVYTVGVNDAPLVVDPELI